jgi:serine/threonine protein phosphatase 1
MITEQLAPATLPDGQRVYAIGDVHGCDDRLAALHDAIAADLAARPVAHPLLIHLGDYIDRGPASAAVLDRLSRPIAAAPGLPTLNLAGNHEDMLLCALESEDPGEAAHWLQNGGGETLASWGLSWRDRPAAWKAGIPPAQRGLLRALVPCCQIGGYIFVHAGLRPNVPLGAQTRQDLLWIRQPFLSFAGTLPAVAVHGHTPEPAPAIRPHRIGIDTGAVLGGALTCAVLEADRVGFLQT